MAKKNITVEVSASAHEVGSAFVKIAKVVKEKLADGWDPFSDTPAIVVAAVAELGAVIGKLGHLRQPEAQLNPRRPAMAEEGHRFDGAGLLERREHVRPHARGRLPIVD